jgi:hypothetical protein
MRGSRLNVAHNKPSDRNGETFMALNPTALANAFVATPDRSNPFGDGQGFIPLTPGGKYFIKFPVQAGLTYTVGTNAIPGDLVLLGPNGLPLNPGNAAGITTFPFTPQTSGVYMLEFTANPMIVAAHQEIKIDITASNLGLGDPLQGGGLQNPNDPNFNPNAGLLGNLPGLINGILGTGPGPQTVQYVLHAPDHNGNGLAMASSDDATQAATIDPANHLGTTLSTQISPNLTTSLTNPQGGSPNNTQQPNMTNTATQPDPLEMANGKSVSWVGSNDAPGTPGSPIQISIADAQYNYPYDSSRPFQFSTQLSPQEDSLLHAATEVWEKVANVHFDFVQDVPTSNAGSPQQAPDVRVGLADLQKALGAQPGMTFVGDTNWNADANNHFLPDTIIGIEDPKESPATQLSDGDLQFNGTTATMFQAMLHELGHALGLDHNPNDPNSIMNPTLSSKNPLPDANDISAVQSLYGAPTQQLSFTTQSDQSFYNTLIQNAGNVS